MPDSMILNEDVEVAEWPTVDEIEGVVRPERDRLEVLTVLVDDYQARRDLISPPDPIAAIGFVLEQQGLSRKDLEDVIGNSGRISEVMNKQRPPQVAHALHQLVHLLQRPVPPRRLRANGAGGPGGGFGAAAI